MDRLTVLGTGNAAVTRCYNTCFLLELPQGYLLCDAGGGNGILSQLEKAGVDFSTVVDKCMEEFAAALDEFERLMLGGK